MAEIPGGLDGLTFAALENIGAIGGTLLKSIGSAAANVADGALNVGSSLVSGLSSGSGAGQVVENLSGAVSGTVSEASKIPENIRSLVQDVPAPTSLGELASPSTPANVSEASESISR